MPSEETFLRDVESPALWLGLAPWLHVDRTQAPPPEARFSSSSLGSPLPFPASGYLELEAILDPAAAACLARAATALRARAIHPTFLYVYDEAWSVLDALRPRLSPFLGRDFDVLADVWAWHIDPETDKGGWPIHRGWYEDVRDETGAPELVNVWVALTNATERNACMHLVPLPDDPHYPRDMRNLTSLDLTGVALPIPAGSALLWNANVAHWGGTCDPSFGEPRISMSFTLRRRSGAASDIPGLRLPLSFRERLDVIADQFETYGEKELPPERPEMRWANMVTTMREAAARLRSDRARREPPKDQGSRGRTT